MPAIRALFMDLDNTLCDDSGSLRLSLASALPLIRKHIPDATEEIVYQTFRSVNNRHWENYDESPIAALKSGVEVRALIAAETLEALGYPNPALAREIAVQFQKARRETYACYKDAQPVLQALKGRIPLVLVTNGNAEMQREKIERCRLAPWLDAIFIAQEIGVSKPSAEVFTTALAAVHRLPQETLMVGDSAEKDILGAKSAGLQTAWMRRDNRDANAPGLNPDYIVRSMNEVLEIVNQHEQ